MTALKKHIKHPGLTKPIGGEYHRNEWVIIGAPCEEIDALVQELLPILSKSLKVAYLNGDHLKKTKETTSEIRYFDNGTDAQLSFNPTPKKKQARKYFNHADLVLMNGNYFIGDKQIVLINEKKKESLSQKTDRLTQIKMILIERSSDVIYDFVLEKIQDEKSLKVFRLKEIEKIATTILNDFIETTPPLYGLILSGGKSMRMGEDKGALNYRGIPHREFEARLAKKFCNQTFISCRKNQEELIESKFKKLYDSFEGLGPYGGILSAFREHPDSAWLVLACDYPLLDESVLRQLVDARNPSKLATCFYNPETEHPEPLVTIWEPRAYPVMLEFLTQGYSCAKKVLINSEVEMIEMKNPTKLMNANNPADRERSLKLLESME